MRAVRYVGVGGPEVIELAEVPTPQPGPGAIRVRVLAAGLNRADLSQRLGRYPAPPGWPADIGGLEYCGEVEALGAGTERWQVGDRVMGLVGGGGHAEYVVVHEDEALAVPDILPPESAAAVPEAFLTAWDALVHRAHLRTGERVLVHAVGSGLGTAMVQVARRLGATVLGTSRTAAKLGRARALGMDQGIDTAQGGFRDGVGAPVNVVIDVLGGPAFEDNLAVLAPSGRLVLLGFLQGPSVETSLAPILRKRLQVIGSVMRARSLAERVALAADFNARVLPWLAAGVIRPVVDAVYPMTAAADAHAAMEGNQAFGKIVLTW